MEQKKIFKVLSKKAMIKILAAVAISGVVPAGAALAQGELVAELVAEQGVSISGKPGDTIFIPVNIYVTPFGTKETNGVTVTANFDGKPSQTISFIANEFNVKKQVMLEYTIPQTTATTVHEKVNMTSTDLTGNDQVSNGTTDYVTINVIQTPKDTTAPTISLIDTISGIYNATNFPGKFKFNLDETSEVFVNGVSLGSLSAGEHELALPAPVQGNNTVSLKAKDAAGNERTPVSFSYFFDSINPEVVATADKVANLYDWYKDDVFVSFTASDINGSGVASVDPPVLVNNEGEHTITGYAFDNAGNKGSSSININIDKTAPTISGSKNLLPNSYGWYKDNVTVSFTADDTLSGIASKTGPVTLGEGVDQYVDGNAADKAGNTATTRVSGINIDKTLPTISGIKSLLPNANGWYKDDVTVSFTADDALSGIASRTEPVTFGEGKDQYIDGYATDKAGNTATTRVSDINIDKTLPTISGSKNLLPNANGWYKEDVTVSFTAEDALSGVASKTGPVILSEGANQSVIGTATDKAGNSASTPVTGINIDKTLPTINGSKNLLPNSYGWYKEDVTVSFTAEDALSGIASQTELVTLGEGEDQSADGYATDKAGNTAYATVSGINIDKTAPVISGFEDGAVFTLNQVVNWTASDSLSGLVTEASGALDTSKTGTQKITTTDKAGNTVEKSYTVIYNFGGVLQPINANGSSIFKAGSTVPVKFQLTDSKGAYVSDAIAKISIAKDSEYVNGTMLEAISTSSATSGNLFRYDSTSNQYIFNLSTKGKTTGTYIIRITLDDGKYYDVQIGLK